MVIFFGPAGAGKSIQSQILAAREGWRWLSMGQMLRDSRDPVLFKTMREGKLVPAEKTFEIVSKALANINDINDVIMDGFPRQLGQAEWLIENLPRHNQAVGLAVVLEVPRTELEKRLKLRGRADDNEDAINERLRLYRHEVYPILNYFTEQTINIVHVDGSGTVGQVHDRIMEELLACRLV